MGDCRRGISSLCGNMLGVHLDILPCKEGEGEILSRQGGRDPLLGKKRSVNLGNCERIEELLREAEKEENGAGAGIRTRAGRRQRILSP